MKLYIIISVLLGASAIAVPVRRAAARDFAQLSISSGTAGNAKAEALAKLPFDAAGDLSTVTADQLSQIQIERETAESAETDAFDPAIDAASGATATALQNGKIKNKVLKLTFEVTALQVQQAQGKDVSSKISEEQTKLNNNIGLDTDAAGQAAQTVTFNG